MSPCVYSFFFLRDLMHGFHFLTLKAVLYLIFQQNTWTEDKLIQLETFWEQQGPEGDEMMQQVSFYSEGDGGGEDEESREGNPEEDVSTMP